MSMERFETIVDAAKEQEIENSQNLDVIESQKNEIKALRKLLNDVKKSAIVEIKDTELIINQPGKEVEHERPDEVEDHRQTVQNIPRLTIRGGLITAKVHYDNPVTGKDTTKTASRNNIMDAIIARNEIAATLLKKGLINGEQFRKATALPEGLIL